MQLIELQNIKHHFGKISVLDDLSLQMEDNQLTCLLREFRKWKNYDFTFDRRFGNSSTRANNY